MSTARFVLPLGKKRPDKTSITFDKVDHEPLSLRHLAAAFQLLLGRLPQQQSFNQRQGFPNKKDACQLIGWKWPIFSNYLLRVAKEYFFLFRKMAGKFYF